MIDEILDFDALDSMTASEAANTVANTIDVLGATSTQIELLEEDLRDALMGAAKEIHHEIGSSVVTAEIDDDDVLVVRIDGEDFLEVDTAGVDL